LGKKSKKWNLENLFASSGEITLGYLESFTSIVNRGDDATIDADRRQRHAHKASSLFEKLREMADLSAAEKMQVRTETRLY
jgi:hypothetical protein